MQKRSKVSVQQLCKKVEEHVVQLQKPADIDAVEFEKACSSISKTSSATFLLLFAALTTNWFPCSDFTWRCAQAAKRWIAGQGWFGFLLD